MTFLVLVDVNLLGSQEVLVCNRQPVHSLVENSASGAEIAAAPCLPALVITSLPLCLHVGRGRYADRLALLGYSLNPLFCEWARLHVRLLG